MAEIRRADNQSPHGTTAIDDSTRLATLGRVRELSGMSQRRAARHIGVRRSVLRSWESGHRLPSPAELQTVIDTYGRDLDDILAPREDLVSHIEPGILQVGSSRIDAATIRLAHTDASAANRAILSEYIAAVRNERGLDGRDALPLRSLDMSQLADALDVSDTHLTEQLADLLDLSPDGARRATRSLLVAGLMGTAILAGVGAGWLGATSSPSGQTAAVADAPSELATAATRVGGEALFAISTEGTPEVREVAATNATFSVDERPHLPSTMFSVNPNEHAPDESIPDAIIAPVELIPAQVLYADDYPRDAVEEAELAAERAAIGPADEHRGAIDGATSDGADSNQG